MLPWYVRRYQCLDLRGKYSKPYDKEKLIIVLIIMKQFYD
jgi:hypothetical protein